MDLGRRRRPRGGTGRGVFEKQRVWSRPSEAERSRGGSGPDGPVQPGHGQESGFILNGVGTGLAVSGTKREKLTCSYRDRCGCRVNWAYVWSRDGSPVALEKLCRKEAKL